MDFEEEEISFIVRVAGLPAEVVSGLHSEACLSKLELLSKLEKESRERREQLVTALESIIGGAADDSRHFWLALKRDGFNGRSLARHATNPLWQTTPSEILASFSEIVARERESAEVLADFESLIESEKQREASELLAHLGDTRFLRGVALSSDSLTEYLPRLLSKEVATYGRRENRLVSSLMRYLSRAAVKVSPFSSLTCIGLGRLWDSAKAKAPHLLVAESWQEHSKVRLQRFRVNQVVAILSRYAPFRAHLQVTLNETVEEADGESQFRYLKGPDWQLNEATGLLREGPYSIVSVRLRGPFVQWLRKRLAGESLPYGTLLSMYQAESSDPSAHDLLPTLDRLLEIGFLEFDRLWHSADPYPEERLHAVLEALPEDEAISSLMANLERILEGEGAYSSTTDPVSLAQELRGLLRGTLRSVAPLAGYSPEIARKVDHRNLHEDVFLETGKAQKEIVSLSVIQYREIVDNLQVFARLSNIRTSQAEFLHSAVSFAMEQWPGRSSVPFYDFFAAINPLFSAFSKHDRESLRALPTDAVVFNPYGLKSLQQLQEARQRLIAELPKCLIDQGSEAVLDCESLLRLIEEVPALYNGSRDFCALVQPLDDQASMWVLNLMAEGRGRLSSRFTATMEESMRQAFAQPFVRASKWKEGEREVEFVDLFCSAGHSANVHVPITQRVFQLPGDSSGLPPERLLRLRDLKVTWRDGDHLPELQDTAGRKILPAHLGSVASVHMPRLVRLLMLFGPSGFYFRRPTLPASNRGGGTQELKRHRVGNVIYRRRTWLVDPSELAAALSGLRGSAAYRYVHQWRVALGMPEQVYVHEPIVIGPSPYTKPQYVDFTSPQLVEIFCAAVKAEVPQIQIVEALPTPEQQFRAGTSPRRAIEIHLESR